MSTTRRFCASVWQDLRFSLRVLRRTRAFTAVAILSLALGIGANTAVFTMANAVLLRTLPVEHPEALVSAAPRFRGEQFAFSYPMARDIMRDQRVLSGAAFTASTGLARARFGNAIIEGVQSFMVSHEYFLVLGIRPAAGRFFKPADDSLPGSARVVETAAVISYGFWERNFARDPSVLGRHFLLDRFPCRVIGIAPQGFFGHETGFATDVWVPLVPFQSRDGLENRRRRAFDAIIGRLLPGVSRAQAEENLTSVFRTLLREESSLGGPGLQAGSSTSDYRVLLAPAATGMGHLQRDYRTPLLIVSAAVALLLLIVCMNVATLSLARNASRSKELGIRLALGATRWNIACQSLVESLLLASGGALAGVPFAVWGTRLLQTFVEFGGAYSTSLDVAPDVYVFLFLTAVTLAAAVASGALPAWRQSTLKASARGPTNTAPRRQWTRGLITVQIALSLVLVNAAVLLGRSLRNLHAVDLGFVPDRVLALFFNSEGRYSSRQQYLELAQRVRARMQELPTVRGAAVSWLEPFYNYVPSADLRVPGYSAARNETVTADYNIVGPGYFSTLGIRLLQGREFTAADRDGTPLAAVVNRTFARRYFAGRPVLGSTFTINRNGYEKRPIRIVGIAENTKRRTVRESPGASIYLCLDQLDRPPNWVSVRTTADPAALAKLARDALREVSEDLVILKVETLAQQVDETLRPERLLTQLIGFFGVAAVLLAAIGLYGVQSLAVEQRTREIGVRMALGARPRQVLTAVLGETTALVAAGSVLGLAGSLLGTRLVGRFLYGIAPRDPWASGAGLLILTAVAFAAAWLPARRAARVDPVIALRAE